MLQHAGHIPLLPLEERNSICRWSGDVQSIDLVGANRQWEAAHS